MGSKHIEASVNSNVGTYRNIQKITANSTITKAGVGVEITSNVGNSASVGFNGVFTVPSQTFALNGNVGWTVPTNTEEEQVQSQGFGPHMHYSSTARVAIKEDPEVLQVLTEIHLDHITRDLLTQRLLIQIVMLL